MMRSPCCDAAVYVRGDYYEENKMLPTRWYACAKCGHPCDPVEKEGEK